MNVLSLDVGFSSTGYVVWKGRVPISCGVVKTEATKKKTVRTADDNAERAMVLANGIKSVIEKYEIKGIVGELPSGGAQSARAIAHMALATGIISAVAAVYSIPCEWCTPIENKKTMTGKRSAGKDEMMDAAIARCGGNKEKKGRSTIYSLADIDGCFCSGEFEHIADAVGAYYALENGTICKLFSSI